MLNRRGKIRKGVQVGDSNREFCKGVAVRSNLSFPARASLSVLAMTFAGF
ncbi:MAG: hypothetical protein WA133_06005 [Syntrophales bacterium]